MSERYDILLRDSEIVDGTGRSTFTGSVGIRGERIAAVGDLRGDAARVIDGAGLVTCPGFVDPHSHADRSILDCPLAENLVMQGITTFAGGNCGFSMAPIRRDGPRGTTGAATGDGPVPDWETFGEWLSTVEEAGLSVNYIPLVGHNTIRQAVIGEDFRRAATKDEIAQMKQWVQEAMRSGAFGLSAGLDAAWPGHFADVEEIIELAKVAEEYGGLFTPHTRHHQNQWPADHPDEFGYGIFHAPKGEIIAGRYHGLLEAVEISRRASGIRLHIAHMTPAYIVPQPHSPFLDESLAKATLVDIIDRARDEGLDVTYNTIAWSQSIGSRVPVIESFFSPRLLLPEWLRALRKEGFAAKLKVGAFRDKVKDLIYSGKFKFGMIHPLTDPYWMDCYKMLECTNSEYEGKTIGEIARKRQPYRILEAVYEESVEVVLDILAEDPEATWALITDKREYGVLPVFLKHPAGMPCTDVGALPGSPPEPYGIPPSAYGMYPHYIRLFVKEMGILSLEEAIRKATSVPAQEVMGLEDRGTIREGAYADIVVLDLETLQESNDFLEPARPPKGIEYVLVNGTMVYEKMAHTGQRPGRVLKRS